MILYPACKTAQQGVWQKSEWGLKEDLQAHWAGSTQMWLSLVWGVNVDSGCEDFSSFPHFTLDFSLIQKQTTMDTYHTIFYRNRRVQKEFSGILWEIWNSNTVISKSSTLTSILLLIVKHQPCWAVKVSSELAMNMKTLLKMSHLHKGSTYFAVVLSCLSVEINSSFGVSFAIMIPSSF